MQELDRRLLDLIQRGFPIAHEPFVPLGERLGVAAGAVIERLRALEAVGLIRAVAGVFEPKRIGHVSSLATMQVPRERLDEVAELVSGYPEVTHNYSRDHAYSLWFALVAHGRERLQAVLNGIAKATGLAVLPLPTLRRFKIRVEFSFSKELSSKPEEPARQAPTEPPPIVPAAIRRLSRPMPLVDKPFAAMAGEAGIGEEELLRLASDYLASGVMRRYGALVRHHKAGFEANAMTVFRVAAVRVQEVGESIAGFPEVSHCYERPPLPELPYNLYAMVHGHKEDECQATVGRIAEAVGIDDYLPLFTLAEHKKASPTYFAGS